MLKLSIEKYFWLFRVLFLCLMVTSIDTIWISYEISCLRKYAKVFKVYFKLMKEKFITNMYFASFQHIFCCIGSSSSVSGTNFVSRNSFPHVCNSMFNNFGRLHLVIWRIESSEQWWYNFDHLAFREIHHPSSPQFHILYFIIYF